MPRPWLGPLLTVLIVGGVALILWANLEPRAAGPPVPAAEPAPDRPGPVEGDRRGSPAGPLADFREYPIGEEIQRNHLQIAAVWLPSVRVDGQEVTAGTDLIHLEADVHALAENPNGLALGEFVPYLKIDYAIVPAAGGPPLTGSLMPMVARDGLHYGATLRMPGPGSYRLTYAIRPPSAGGLGRHTDPATGVDPWWEPFTATFAWDFPPAPAAPSPAGPN